MLLTPAAILPISGIKKTARPRLSPVLGALALAATLAACGPAPTPVGFSDPLEAQNRAVHGFNLALDRNLLRPVARSTSKALPELVERGISNFADNLELPGSVVNNLLQLRLGRAVQNSLRFAINTTIGIGGLFDPASAAGVMARPSDFGETLHVWGVPEGNYLELPVLGPSSERDAVGQVVDIVLDPFKLILPKDSNGPLIAKVAGKIVDRGRYSETVDSVLYDSADSYAQARLLYLQNRRFELGQAPAEDSFEDPYAE